MNPLGLLRCTGLEVHNELPQLSARPLGVQLRLLGLVMGSEGIDALSNSHSLLSLLRLDLGTVP